MDKRNLVWLNSKDVEWLEQKKVQIAYLWGNPQAANGSFVKLPAGFKGFIENDNDLKVVMVSGKASHQWANEKTHTQLLPSSFFSSQGKGRHKIKTETEVIFYVNSNGRYIVE